MVAYMLFRDENQSRTPTARTTQINQTFCCLKKLELAQTPLAHTRQRAKMRALIAKIHRRYVLQRGHFWHPYGQQVRSPELTNSYNNSLP